MPASFVGKENMREGDPWLVASSKGTAVPKPPVVPVVDPKPDPGPPAPKTKPVPETTE